MDRICPDCLEDEIDCECAIYDDDFVEEDDEDFDDDPFLDGEDDDEDLFEED